MEKVMTVGKGTKWITMHVTNFNIKGYILCRPCLKLFPPSLKYFALIYFHIGVYINPIN